VATIGGITVLSNIKRVVVGRPVYKSTIEPKKFQDRIWILMPLQLHKCSVQFQSSIKNISWNCWSIRNDVKSLNPIIFPVWIIFHNFCKNNSLSMTVGNLSWNYTKLYMNKIMNLRHSSVEWELWKVVKNNQNGKATGFRDFTS
jgi:hypothetical protein